MLPSSRPITKHSHCVLAKSKHTVPAHLLPVDPNGTLVAASTARNSQHRQQATTDATMVALQQRRSGTSLTGRILQQPSQRPSVQQQAGSQLQALPQQQQQRQQHQQQAPAVMWGYLTGSDADQWTWDDDYSKAARARAQAAAKALPPTPRQQALAQEAEAAAQQRPTVVTRLPEHFNSKVLSNGVLLIDKPPRWSSADVVRQLKSALKLKKVGHGGPLDAHASGLLILLLGAATRLTPKLEPLERTYTGTIQLGTSTTTYDSTGQILQSNPWQHLTDADIAAAAASFQGEVLQVPCMWSSTKYQNRPLRWYAERGETVAREPKSVHISSIEVWRDKSPAAATATAAIAPSLPQRRRGAGAAAGSSDMEPAAVSSSSSSSSSSVSDEVHFRVVASKGTSMRVLADDIGKALGCGAHLTSLRRESIGGFSVDTAWALDVLLPLAKKYGKGYKFAPLS